MINNFSSDLQYFVNRMGIKEWIINFKPGEHIRELAILITIFLFAFLAIFVTITNNKNEKVEDSFSKFPDKASFLAAMAAAAQAQAAAAMPTNSTVVPGHSPEEIFYSTTIDPFPQAQPAIENKDSETMVIPLDTTPEQLVPTSPLPSILHPPSGEASVVYGPQGHIYMPTVIKSIPQSTVKSDYKPKAFTTSGWIHGIAGDFEGKYLDVFLGVPYAQPPIGELRFRNPTKVIRQDNPIDCSSFKPHCLQKFNPAWLELRTPTTNIMSEDCLYLNIWRPRRGLQPTFSSTSKGKPIMIWVFGGGFQGGSNNLDEFDGRVLAAKGDVIVVTINYRNGPLGYLDLGTSDIPGNQGLRDIVTAIDWVVDNAVNLNGNPSAITLFGQSSGSIAISLLMSNNEIASKVRRVILQSGSPLIPGKMFERSLTTSVKFAKSLNCINRDKSSTSSCLRSITSQDLYRFYPKLSFAPKSGDDLIPFLPSDLFFKKPDDVKAGKYYNATLEVMIGVTSNESSLMMMLDFPERFPKDGIKLRFNSVQDVEYFVEQEAGPMYGLSSDESYLIFNTFFPTNDLSPEGLMNAFLKLTSDLMFVCPSKLFAEKYAALSRSPKVFFYEFTQRWKKSPVGEWAGVTHGDDYSYVFGLPLRYPERYTAEDVEVSEYMISAWTSFARTGVPKSRNDYTNWPFYNGGKYMRISSLNSSIPVINYDISHETCSKFAKIYNELK